LSQPATTQEDKLYSQAAAAFFKDIGIVIEPPGSIFFTETNGLLLARTTRTNHYLMEKVLLRLNAGN
jgi:hypothetical protein